MRKGIIILGNGFDLDLGLKTSYADFAKSSQWAELMSGNIHSNDKDMLLGFLKSKLNVLASKFNVSMEYDATHIHGSLSDEGNIILGMETDRGIDDRYSFLYKTQNRQYRHTDILKDLRDKDEYVFFGHSLNGMDYTYFKSIFGILATNTLSTPGLTIITKDVNAENSFKNFLRREFISLQSLYSNTIPTFILTDEIYRQSDTEINKVQKLLGHINAM